MEMVRMKYEDEENSNVCLKESDSAFETNENESSTITSEKDLPHSSLLALLDDKNRSITLLKKQVHNQKLQLSFYLHRVLNSHKVTQLAETCRPHEAEENLQVNLAMNKFLKQAGLKSRIMTLHGRMFDMEKRMIRMTIHQEDMIREIVTKLVDFVKNGGEESNVLTVLAELNSDSGQLETLAKILTSTNKLRKELDTFRTCCNRLIVIEDERNALVEHVYSMPITQRLNYEVLLTAQYEKVRLEREVQEIKQEQAALQERLSHLSPNNQSINCNPPVAPEEGDVKVQKMLEAVNCEAVNLLAMAKDQKDKYLQEITKLKQSNTNLAQQVVSLKEIVRQKEDLDYKMALAIEEIQRLKSNGLKERVQLLNEENNALNEKLKHYYDVQDEVKCLRTQLETAETVKSQRDYYRAQVEDLQAIRAAYAQLVEHCPSRGGEPDAREQMEKITDLEQLRDEMEHEIRNLKETIGEQETQIKYLLKIIDKLGTFKETQIGINKFKDPMVYNAHHAVKNDSGYSVSHKGSYRSQVDEAQERSTVCCTKVPGFVDHAHSTLKKHHTRRPESPSESPRDKHDDEFSQANSKHFPKSASLQSPIMSTTSVEIQSVNQDGKSEFLKAVLDSSCVESTIQVNNSNALSLRLMCGTPGRLNKNEYIVNTMMPVINEERPEKRPCKLDEFELMKDSSRETVVATLPSVHHCSTNLLSVKCLEYTEEVLNKHDKDVNVIVSKRPNSRDDNSESGASNDEANEYKDTKRIKGITQGISKIEEHDAEDVADNKVGVRGRVSDLSNRLRQLTSDLDNTLSRPGGRDTLLNTVKLMYNNIFSINDNTEGGVTL